MVSVCGLSIDMHMTLNGVLIPLHANGVVDDLYTEIDL